MTDGPGGALRKARRTDPRARPDRRQRRLLRPRPGRAAADRDRPRDGPHPRAVPARPVPQAHRRRLRTVRQQRPLPAGRAHHPAPAEAPRAGARIPAAGADDLVRADGARSVEPAPRQDAWPLRRPRPEAPSQHDHPAAPAALARSTTLPPPPALAGAPPTPADPPAPPRPGPR